MKKIILLVTIITFTAFNGYSQRTSTLTGTIVDESTNETVPGAVIEVTPEGNDRSRSTASDTRGGFSLAGASYGRNIIKVSFFGYEDHIDTVNITTASTNLGRIGMKLDAKQIEKISFEAQAMRTSQRGDTVVYNADAFKVAKDADAEGLLSKMPGINVIDGEVEAQGETVKKVYVDGKEFFGEDVTTAIRNLPAEVIQRVEVYNKLSDQSEFTGIDDGEGYKALNFVTTINRGQFGKLYGLYGIDDKYMVGGNVNFFSGDSRISILGLSNNINQQNFAMEDILGAVSSGRGGVQSRGGGRMRMGGAGGFLMRPQDGISKVHSLGINYTDKWAKKVDVSASYFFNTTKNDNVRIADREYVNIDDQFSHIRTITGTRNYENRFNGRLEYKINDNHTLMYRPRFSFQSYKSDNSSIENQTLSGQILRDIENLANSKNHGYNINNNLIYRAKLGKTGRTLTVEGRGGTSKNDRTNFTYNTIFYPLDPDAVNNQKRINDSKNWNAGGSVIYTEPIFKNAQISAQYNIDYRYSDADTKTYDFGTHKVGMRMIAYYLVADPDKGKIPGDYYGSWGDFFNDPTFKKSGTSSAGIQSISNISPVKNNAIKAD